MGAEYGCAVQVSALADGKGSSGDDAAVMHAPLLSRSTWSAGAVRAALSEGDLAKIVAKTDGYSGSDMAHLVREVCRTRGLILKRRSGWAEGARVHRFGDVSRWQGPDIGTGIMIEALAQRLQHWTSTSIVIGLRQTKDHACCLFTSLLRSSHPPVACSVVRRISACCMLTGPVQPA